MKCHLPNEEATLALAGRLYRALPDSCLIYLRGDLGAGKTAFVRGCLRATGYRGAVKSPTFTLVEEYALEGRVIYHFDLYRLADPEELEWMGIRDYLRPGAICFIEWPERGEGLLPVADLDVAIAIDGAARHLSIGCGTALGRQVLEQLEAGPLC